MPRDRGLHVLPKRFRRMARRWQIIFDILKETQLAADLQDLQDLQDLHDANVMEARIAAGLEKTVELTQEQLDRNVATRSAAGGLMAEAQWPHGSLIPDRVEHGHNGCTCACHHTPGMMHCVPCCYPTLQPESP